ncbi:sodium/pantothenate symporter [Selenomonas sp. TAMA-11512]|uniref:sodium/pantothenate symporter n=1 Tax=Selenomonas sp. TAMA-11512 TaxID=3095337 RepID=UPI0030938443|nr:sodium/pantothenate symporter [Selenomonas sp. TAMA-11512]
MREAAALMPLLLFMALMVGIGFLVRANADKGFVRHYFVGSRNLGGFVLAMTTVATYSSVSSFVGGPGMAWQVGFGWIYMAVVQVTAIFLVLGIFGKRVARLSRRLHAVTIVDLIRARFGSDALATVSAFVIVLFFLGTMTAQFVGGAKLFEAVTGRSYMEGLLLFGMVVVVYTAIGGFRAVALTDTLCAIVMMAGIVLLLYYVLDAGGGYAAIMTRIEAEHPEMLTPFAGGKMPWTIYFTQWLLVGICTIALPQSVVRGISYRDTEGLHKAMLIGTFVIGFMNIGINFTGILSHGVLTEPIKAYGTVDSIIPQAIARAVPAELVGFAIIGPLAASISTISGLLIVAASAVIKDVFLHNREKADKTIDPRTIRRFSMATTTILGVLVFALAASPPTLIWLINMFAFGGLETAFFWVMLLGLYWKGANLAGAAASMIGGTAIYCVLQAFPELRPLSLHPIAVGIPSSLLLFLLGCRFGKRTEEERLRVFFEDER